MQVEDWSKFPRPLQNWAVPHIAYNLHLTGFYEPPVISYSSARIQSRPSCLTSCNTHPPKDIIIRSPTCPSRTREERIEDSHPENTALTRLCFQQITPLCGCMKSGQRNSANSTNFLDRNLSRRTMEVMRIDCRNWPVRLRLRNCPRSNFHCAEL